MAKTTSRPLRPDPNDQPEPTSFLRMDVKRADKIAWAQAAAKANVTVPEWVEEQLNRAAREQLNRP